MHIAVCVKQVPDWDIPPSSFKVDEGTKKVVPPPGVAPVPSQFDSIGVEAAMRIKVGKTALYAALAQTASEHIEGLP